MRISARRSDLARIQAYRVAEALRSYFPDLHIEFQFRESLGDRNLTDPLWKMPERGVFTEDFAADLLAGKTDMVVHSWKDLPLETRAETVIAATLPRADSRDILLVRKAKLKHIRESRELKVLSSSPRREYNLTPFFLRATPFLLRAVHFHNVRGNVPTRIAHLIHAESDALVLAKAALDRLLSASEGEFGDMQRVLREHLAQCHWMVLPLSVNPTAPAQGALAIEVRRDRNDLLRTLERIHCAATFADVCAEREVLAQYGGGCHQKIGVTHLTRNYGVVKFKRGLSETGEEFHQVALSSTDSELSGPVSAGELRPLLETPELFERESLPVSQPTAGRDLWVARANAVPESWSLPEGQLVWTAGVKSWFKLAARGIWVNGTNDSLGEHENTELDWILGRKPKWLRLTHESAPGRGEKMATYRLKLKSADELNANVNLAGFSHYFWMSGSQFDQAIQLEPAIASALHACGPGNTFEHICVRLRELGVNSQPQIYLSFESWKYEMELKIKREMQK